MQRILIYLLYRSLQAVAFPLIVAHLMVRGLREPRYFHRISERFGWLPHFPQRTDSGSIWLHAVSVGEVISAVRLLERLREEYPARRLYVSSTTLAGRALAKEKLAGLADEVFYAPIDYCFAVRRVLRELRPSVVVVLETEIWPNFYREAKRFGAGLVVVNGRLSDRAMPRYRRLRWFFRHVLDIPDAILAQDEAIARRYRELGAPPDRVRVGGNLKYEFDCGKLAPPDEILGVIRNSGPERVWIAASTMPPAADGDVDEDKAVIEAFRRLTETHPRTLLILVPRRPQMFPLAAEKLREAGVEFVRRSELCGEDRIPLPGALLLDSIGELSSLFGLASVVFMGGTLARRGGHNILEPAFFARPIIVGPHMENFQAIADEFQSGDAAVSISHPAELAGAVAGLFEDNTRSRELGECARRLAESKSGASDRALAEIQSLSEQSIPRPIRPLLVRGLLWPLSRIWKLGWRWKRSRALSRRKRLPVPVVSVGGIGMGGAGKTPCVLHLARCLKDSGTSPAILTRGYRRQYPEKSSIVAAGATAATELTGDEAQLFLKSGLAPVGIGADRFCAGSTLLERYPADVILLDDGFQHWRLDRDIDIVLIDALDPFAGEALFPSGRLREPLQALARADAFLITRWEPGRPAAAIRDRLRQLNSEAPTFLSRTVPLEWCHVATGRTSDPSSPSERKVAAFCGLANPDSFWQTLGSLHIAPVERWEFADHHRYVPRQLRHIAGHARAAGAEVLLTTEKDLMNLPPETPDIVKPLEVSWLRIGIEIDDEPELLDFIRRRLQQRAGASTSARGRAETASSGGHPRSRQASHPRR